MTKLKCPKCGKAPYALCEVYEQTFYNLLKHNGELEFSHENRGVLLERYALCSCGKKWTSAAVHRFVVEASMKNR